MPELPEVETIRRTLEHRLIGARVRRVRVHRRDILSPGVGTPAALARPNTPTQTPRRLNATLLRDAHIDRLTRRGKRLAITARDGRCIEIHLGMSGRLLLLDPRTHAPEHTHLVWSLDDGTRLIFSDPRRFGFVRAHRNTDDLARAWLTLGPDALSIRGDTLRTRAETSRRAIKAILLDQRVLAGVGNIYADEALFDARIHPAHRGCELDPPQWRSLAASIRRVLRRAIEARGTTLRDYRNADGSSGQAGRILRVYGRGGQPCPRCGNTLTSAAIAQRTTTWCPHCQATQTHA